MTYTSIISKVKLTAFTSVVLLSLIASVISPLTVIAAVQNPSSKAQVSFTFDDGFEDTYTKAAPVLAQYGMTGTAYVTTGCVGIKVEPNNCPADRNAKYMSWAEVKALQNSYGWEIGSHTVTHPLLASSDRSIGQPRRLTSTQITSELVNSKNALTAQGLRVNSIATPYGDYSNETLKQIAKYYTNHRGYWDTGYNAWPYNDYLIRDQQVLTSTPVETLKGYVDTAIANGEWLVLTFHEIVDDTAGEDNYAYSTAKLNEIAAYVATKNIQVTNVSESTVTSDTNLMPNSSFTSGITNGWTKDSNQISLNTSNNGNFPSSTQSVRFASSSVNTHLYSPKVSVDPSVTYLYKSFLNVESVGSGEIGYYIDEYDAAGNWISGQWKRSQSSVFVQNVNFTYKPSSSAVKKASLQIYNNANSGVNAYLDNVQLFALTTPIVVPTPTNLVANGTFNAGLSLGWTTDSPSTITADSTNNGSPENQLNSVKLTSNTAGGDRHLFSPLVAVNSGFSYTIGSYLKIAQINNGEVGYYIDEYDAAGNWISGQWKGAKYSTGAFAQSINYTPSSNQVSSASLQVIVSGGATNVVAYFDDVTWYKN